MTQTLLDEVIDALSAYIFRVTGVMPRKTGFRLSRSGELSLNAFIRQDAKRAAEALRNNADACVLWSVRLLREVREENGWLLFDLSPAFFTRLCDRAAVLDRDPGTDYVSMRMRMLSRKPASPCPDHCGVRLALLRSLLADDKGRFTAEDDRAVLTMTHGEKGMERIALENRCGTVALALLKLRAPHR